MSVCDTKIATNVLITHQRKLKITVPAELVTLFVGRCWGVSCGRRGARESTEKSLHKKSFSFATVRMESAVALLFAFSFLAASVAVSVINGLPFLSRAATRGRCLGSGQ